jgi:hypothetical protein
MTPKPFSALFVPKKGNNLYSQEEENGNRILVLEEEDGENVLRVL